MDRGPPTTPGETVAREEHVLLEQCATFSGRQLKVRVTATNAASPDTAVVGLCYGGDQAEVTLTALDQEPGQTLKGEEGRRKLAQGSQGSAEEHGSSSVTMQTGRGRDRGILPVEETAAPLAVNATDRGDVGVLDGAPSLADAGQSEKMPLDAPDNVGVPTLVASSIQSEHRGSPGAASVPSSERTELRIGRNDPLADLDDDKLEELLRSMPALRCLSIDWSDRGGKLNIDIVSQHCSNLREIDLTRFRLDTWSLEQLCVACPDLEVVKLPRKCDDSQVKILLDKLPRLRSLDLAETKVTGEFLETCEQSLEKLSLAKCKRLAESHVMESLRSSKDTVQTAPWSTLRELNLSHICVKNENLVEILKRCTRIERLQVAVIGETSDWLTQLGGRPELRELEVTCESLACPSQDCSKIESNWLSTFLSDSQKLERLVLSGIVIKGELVCLRQLASCSALRDLDLSHVHILKEEEHSKKETFDRFARSYPRACRIHNYPHGKPIDTVDLAEGLSGCPLLERLNIAGMRAPLGKLVPPTGLPKLTHLNANFTRLTNNSLRRLPQLFPMLSDLEISGCRSVSGDALMSYVPRLQHLRSLVLTDVPAATDDLVDKLKKKCPAVEVIYDALGQKRRALSSRPK